MRAPNLIVGLFSTASLAAEAAAVIVARAKLGQSYEPRVIPVK